MLHFDWNISKIPGYILISFCSFEKAHACKGAVDYWLDVRSLSKLSDWSEFVCQGYSLLLKLAESGSMIIDFFSADCGILREQRSHLLAWMCFLNSALAFICLNLQLDDDDD